MMGGKGARGGGTGGAGAGYEFPGPGVDPRFINRHVLDFASCRQGSWEGDGLVWSRQLQRVAAKVL